MPDINSILVLLQLVIVMLSNPVLANNTSTQALANQAIGLATQALTQLSQPIPAPISQPTSTPIITPIPTQTTPTPAQNLGGTNVVAPTPPSCTLTATVHFPTPATGGTVMLSWTLQGMASDTIGYLYTSNGHDGNKMTYYPNPTTLTPAQMNVSMFSRRAMYKAVFGDTTCLTFFNGDINNIPEVEGDTSTSTIPDYWQGMIF